MANLAELLGDLDEEAVLEAIDEVVAANGDGLAAVAELQKGMDKVGELFENGEYFVGDLIFAGEILKQSVS